MPLSISNERLKSAIVIVTVLVSINLWSFTLISDEIFTLLEFGIIALLLVIVLYNSFILGRKFVFKNNVLFFMSIPLLGALGAYVFHDQEIKLSLLILRVNLLWLFYFVLHIFDLPKERIFKLITIIGLIWALLTTIQQLTYPTFYFSSRIGSSDNALFRNGVYRFMIYSQQYGAFFLFYFFYQYLTKRKNKYLIYVLIGLVGFYCYGTRQFAVAALASLFIATFFVKGKSQLIAVVAILMIVPSLFLLKDVLFAQYIEQTNEQFKYGDDVRQLSANFFLNEYWPDSWLAKITGNGPAHMLSRYGHEMEIIREYNHFYRSDVGIIGAFNEFGIFYVINILWVNFKGLRNKYYTFDDKFLKLLFIYSIILLITSQYYSHHLGIPFYCLVFYLTEKSFEEKKSQASMQTTDVEELEMAI